MRRIAVAIAVAGCCAAPAAHAQAPGVDPAEPEAVQAPSRRHGATVARVVAATTARPGLSKAGKWRVGPQTSWSAQPQTLLLLRHARRTRVGEGAAAEPPRTAARAGSRATCFFKLVRPETVTASTVKLTRKGSSTPVGATVTYNPTTNCATLDPASSLRSDATYVATVGPGIDDLAGNALATVIGWSFTVKR